MSERSERYQRWKEAQRREAAYYQEMVGRRGYSQDYDYGYSELWSHRFNRFLVKDLDGKVILEIGASVFGPIYYVAPRAAFKVALDPLFGSLFKEFAVRDISYVQGVGEHLPFQESSFDVVICHNVLDHVIDPRVVLSEVARILKPRGALLLCVNTFARTALMTLGSIIKRLDRTHTYHLSSDEVYEMVSRSGLQIVEYRKILGYDAPQRTSGVFIDRIRMGRWKLLLAYPFFESTYVTAVRSSAG